MHKGMRFRGFNTHGEKPFDLYMFLVSTVCYWINAVRLAVICKETFAFGVHWNTRLLKFEIEQFCHISHFCFHLVRSQSVLRLEALFAVLVLEAAAGVVWEKNIVGWLVTGGCCWSGVRGKYYWLGCWVFIMHSSYHTSLHRIKNDADESCTKFQMTTLKQLCL